MRAQMMHIAGRAAMVAAVAGAILGLRALFHRREECYTRK